ncbi:MAG: barH [Myxococcales bacterium]|nr:barH [Myxococcales bacterium]
MTTENRPRFIDADAHIFEQLDMWDRIPKPYQSRIEHRFPVEDPYYHKRIFDTYLDGEPIPTWMGQDRLKRFRLIPRMLKKFPDGAPGMEPERMLKDFDIEGLDAAAIYPTLCLFAPWIPKLGAGFASAIATAYNDWIYDFCSVDRRRLRPVAVISFHDVSSALKEIERCAARNFVGAFMRPNPLYNRTLGSEDYFPIYKALEQAGMTVGIHEGNFSLLPTAGLDRVKDQAGHHIVCHPLEQMLAFLSLYQAEVFAKFPKLNFLFLECGTLWAPYWIERMDAELREYRSNQSGRAPSEIFRDQCFVSTEVDDHFLPTVLQLMGEDNVLMSTDYPHDESHYPNSHKLFMDQAISEAARDKVGRTNTLRAYPRF